MGARCADVFAGAKGMCLRQGASRSEVEGGFFSKNTPFGNKLPHPHVGKIAWALTADTARRVPTFINRNFK